MISGNPLITPGTPTPINDGVTPVFVSLGADPRTGAGFDAPLSSVCRFGATNADYLVKTGTGPNDWGAIGGGGDAPVWESLRAESQIPFTAGTTRIHPWGPQRMEANNAEFTTFNEVSGVTLQGGTEDILYAVPMLVTRAFDVRALIAKIASNPGATRLGRMGIYADTTIAGEHVPGALLFDGGDVDASTSGAKAVAIGAGVVSGVPGDVLWSAWNHNAAFNAAGTTTYGVKTGVLYPIGGFTMVDTFATAADRDSAGVGWRHAQAFGAMPATFPTASLTRLVCTGTNAANTSVPCLFFAPVYT